jgi:NADH-quinone oxidoreductase subunit N
VVAAGSPRPAIAGGSQEADAVLDAPGSRAGFGWVEVIAVVCAITIIAIGVYPEPLFNVAKDAGAALHNLL